MSKKLTTEQFIEKAKNKHGDKYDYSKVNYINSNTKVCIICPKHGEFWQEPNNHLSGNQCPICSKEKNRNDLRLSQKEFLDRALKIHGDKFDYSKVEYIDLNTPIILGCKIHGDYFQRPSTHLAGHGCPKCSKNYRYTTKEFIEKANQIHGNKYDYSKVEYIRTHSKIEIICKKHGSFFITPAHHLQGEGCPICKSSQGEERISEFLINNNIKFVNDKACLKFLGSLRPDFYLPDYNLVIEYDGIQHFEDIKIWGKKNYNSIKSRDNLKEQLCEENGIKVLRIPYWEYNNIENILKEKLK